MLNYFLLGFIAAVLSGLLWLRSPKRIRLAARVLISIANGIEGKPIERVKAETPAAPAENPLAEEIASALQNMGAKKKPAIAAARQVVDAGAADFATGFRDALAFVRKAA
jgi:thiamine pyrophosphate-dependent acetolactate synthase large subunit-like protein